MIKESRILVRLIALWVILILSIGLILWSAYHLTTSVIKSVNGGYEVYSVNPVGYGGNMYCLPLPVYPQTSGGMGMPLTAEDKAAFDKYSKDYAKYNAEVELRCKEDLARQEKSQEAQEKSVAMGDITSYALLLVFGGLIKGWSYVQIRKSERVV